MARTQPTTHSPCLTIDIATLIATQEQRHPRNLIRNSTTLQRIQLTDLPLRPTLPGMVKHRLRHSCLDQTRADGVDPDARAGELVRAGLGDGYNGCLGGRVIRRAGIGPESSDGGGADD